MFPSCEVKDCKDIAEHTLSIGQVRVAVCTGHMRAARKVARKYAIKLLENTADIHDEFLDAVANIKEEQ